MSRKGENIYKRKDGRWEGRYIKQYTEDKKAKYGYIYGKSYKETKEKLMQAISTKQERVSEQRKGDSELTVAFAVEEWLSMMMPRVKETTIIKYQNLLQAYILPYWGTETIQNISRVKMEAYCNELLLRGGCKQTGLSPKTVVDILSLIKTIFRFIHQKENWIPYEIYDISIKQYPKTMRVFSLQEQQKLCRYLYQNPSGNHMGVLLCLLTGIRVGEVCALKWKDISLEEKTVYIHQTMQRIQVRNQTEQKTKVLISTPKSQCSIRKIPLPNDFLTLLREQKQNPETYFLTGKESIFVEPRTMQNRFKSILKACNIEDANFHTLRHTFATRCVEVGFDLKSLSEILGHANVNITLNRYVHPSMDLKRENMQKVSELFAVK